MALNWLGRFAGEHGRFTALLAVPDIGHMQKGGPLQANINKRRLHPRQNPRHLAQVDVADQAALQSALHVQLLHRAAFHDGDAGFLGSPVDEDVLLLHKFY